MQVVAIVTTIGLFLLKRKHTINLSFNLLYCWKAYINATAQVRIHYTLLCHCPLKSYFRYFFLSAYWKESFRSMYFPMSNLPRMKAEMFRGLGFFLFLSFRQYFTAHALPSPPASKTLWSRPLLWQNTSARKPTHHFRLDLSRFTLYYWMDFILHFDTYIKSFWRY